VHKVQYLRGNGFLQKLQAIFRINEYASYAEPFCREVCLRWDWYRCISCQIFRPHTKYWSGNFIRLRGPHAVHWTTVDTFQVPSNDLELFGIPLLQYCLLTEIW